MAALFVCVPLAACSEPGLLGTVYGTTASNDDAADGTSGFEEDEEAGGTSGATPEEGDDEGTGSSGDDAGSTSTSGWGDEGWESDDGPGDDGDDDPGDDGDDTGPNDPPPLFVDVSDALGVGYTHSSWGAEYVPGVGWTDVDGDGRLDLYLTDHDQPNHLLLGTGDKFEPWQQMPDLADSFSTGALFGDYDNDGRPDLYVSAFGVNSLLHNTGEAFVDVTDVAGVGEPSLGVHGAWGDIDSDGWLDLYVGSWNAETFVNSSVLYHNDGDGTFTNVSQVLAGGDVGNPMLAATFFDYDNDGDLDLYVVVDKNHGNVFWRNDGPGCGGWCFTDVTVEVGADYAINGMGIATGDYDNDGDLDMYFTDIGEMYLLQNQTAQGEPVFLDVTVASGAWTPQVGWGAVMFDFDNDGWLDIYCANGMTFDLPDRNQLYWNRGDGTFDNISEFSGADHPGMSQAVAYADYDRDGFLDLAIGNNNQDYMLLHNEGLLGANNHWIALDLEGSGPVNRDAIGARVRLERTDGLELIAEVHAGSSLGATHELALHFGLGHAEIAALAVTWPNGVVEQVDPSSIDLDAYNALVYGG